MRIFNFDHEPTFAELWDVCVYNFLYQIEDYKKDLESLFQTLGISRESKIVDICAGGGFPSIELIQDGYNIICSDGSDDEVKLFNRKAREQALNVSCTKVLWQELPALFPNDSFDLLFCRGNSFIYADGGWNSSLEVDRGRAVHNYKDTLKIFYNLLTPGGWIYIDKFKDTEPTHREKICEIAVNGGESEDLIFWTERFPEHKNRQASMIRESKDRQIKTPNITYDLSSQELESFLAETGFKNCRKLSISSEKNFDVWVAQKD